MCNPCFQGVEPADTDCQPTHKQIQAQTLIRCIELSIKAPGRQPKQTSRALIHVAQQRELTLRTTLCHPRLSTSAQPSPLPERILQLIGVALPAQRSRKRIYKIPSKVVL